MRITFWNWCAGAIALVAFTGACGPSNGSKDGGPGGAGGGSGGGTSGGGTSGNMTCSVQPCGGEVVGTWRASSACLDQATLNMQFLAGLAGDCPTATLTNINFAPSGTMTFGTELTYTAALTMSGTMDMNMPASCLNGQTCAMVNQNIQSSVSGSITSASCTGSGSCVCTLHMSFEVENSSGTYATSGTTLSLTATGSATDSGPYCVQASTLHLIGVDMTMPMGKVQSDIVFTKQ